MANGNSAPKLQGFAIPENGYTNHSVELLGPDGRLLAHAEITHDPSLDPPGTAFVAWLFASEPRRGYASELLQRLERHGVTPTWSHRGNSPEGDAFIAAYEATRGRQAMVIAP
jgi:hypothetical protein